MNPMKDDPNPDSDLRRQLKEQAMRERPSFSPKVHRHVMDQIRDASFAKHSSRPSRWRITAAAAIFLLAGAIALGWMMRARREIAAPQIVHVTGESPVVPRETARPAMAFLDKPLNLTIHLDGLLSAQITPMQITIGVPTSIADASVPERILPAPPPAPVGSPEWLLARFEEPADGAQAVIREMIPSSVRSLAETERITK